MVKQIESSTKLNTFTPDFEVKPNIRGFVPPRFVELAEPWVRYHEIQEKSSNKKK